MTATAHHGNAAASTDYTAKEKRTVTRGVTDSITTAGACDEDIAVSIQMRKDLEEHHPGESVEGMERRTKVLQQLESLATEWVRDVAINEGREEYVSSENNSRLVKLCTFGSYRLGAVNPGSDIDALLLGPNFVSREHFFTGMVKRLRECPDVTDLLPVPDAYTPIVSLKLNGVELDLLYCQLDMETLPEDLNLTASDSLLRGLDDKDLRSINGCRVAEMILSMVPDVKIYTDTLKFIKCWAKRRGIYSNVIGYFGGITWALCVARVCQLYPNYCMSMLVSRFFRVFDQWNWGKPILLCPIKEQISIGTSNNTNSNGQLLNFKVWNPKANPTDRAHLMPVITPAFPSMNSTHNVTDSTKRIICDEIHRGYQICKEVENKKMSYTDLFKPSDFFHQYKNYLMIVIEVNDEDGFRRYSGWVESKIRLLVSNLENTSGLRVHPYSRNCSWATVEDQSLVPEDQLDIYSCAWFIGLAFSQDSGAFAGQTVDVRPAVNPFIDVLQDWKELPTTAVKIKVIRLGHHELPPYVHIQEDPLKAKSSKIRRLKPADTRKRTDGGPGSATGSQGGPSTETQHRAPSSQRATSQPRPTNEMELPATTTKEIDETVIRSDTELSKRRQLSSMELSSPPRISKTTLGGEGNINPSSPTGRVSTILPDDTTLKRTETSTPDRDSPAKRRRKEGVLSISPTRRRDRSTSQPTPRAATEFTVSQVLPTTSGEGDGPRAGVAVGE